jgi:hypothetical protein
MPFCQNCGCDTPTSPLYEWEVWVILEILLANGVATKVLNQAVKRNRHRFPEDFMFQVNEAEAEVLRS